LLEIAAVACFNLNQGRVGIIEEEERRARRFAASWHIGYGKGPAWRKCLSPKREAHKNPEISQGLLCAKEKAP